MQSCLGKLVLLILLPILFCCMIALPQCYRRPELGFAPDELPDARVGEPYQATITVLNYSTSVFVISVPSDDLPPGLSLHYEENEDTAEIRGVPTEAGEYSFTVSAACHGTNVDGQSGSRIYQIVVKGD